MKPELKQAFHGRLAEPKEASPVIHSVIKEGFPEGEVRTAMWDMLAAHELTFSDDLRTLQNGENYTRQLAFPGWKADGTPIFEANQEVSE